MQSYAFYSLGSQLTLQVLMKNSKAVHWIICAELKYPISTIDGSLAAAVAGLIGTSFTLGIRLYSLYDQYCAASKEFEAFGREVKAFGGTWQMVQPCLEDAQPLLSLDCLQTLTNICNGTNDILKDVTETVEIFAIEDKKDTGEAKQGTAPGFLCFGNKTCSSN
jgi:hypothetical protein